MASGISCAVVLKLRQTLAQDIGISQGDVNEFYYGYKAE
jgi:hypothetical protein